MLFTLNRNHVHVTREGPSFRFVKGGPPTQIPRRYAAEVIALGAEPAPEDAEEATEAKRQADAELAADRERLEKVKSTIRALIERNQSGDFTAGGRPNGKKVSALVGDKVTDAEIDAAFAEVKGEEE